MLQKHVRTFDLIRFRISTCRLFTITLRTTMNHRKTGLTLALLIALTWMPSQCIANDGYGLEYDVTIVNEWPHTVRFKRCSDEQDAKADIASGQSETFRIRFDSDQVFMAFGKKKLLGDPQTFVPRKSYGGISMRVTREGQLVMALKSR